MQQIFEQFKGGHTAQRSPDGGISKLENLTGSQYNQAVKKLRRNMNIQFEKVDHRHQKVIFAWLEEPHVKEFWDNSQAHKDDIINFIQGREKPSNYTDVVHGRKEPSSYAGGQYIYWIGSIENIPYCFMMTIKEKPGEKRPEIKEAYISKTGTTYSIDYMIGNKEYFGKGLGAPTLEEFTQFFKDNFDSEVDTFFIDPDESNPRAKHIYEKAGFECVGDFIMEGDGFFTGKKTYFMVKKLID